jgi:hypothetical protein
MKAWSAIVPQVQVDAFFSFFWAKSICTMVHACMHTCPGQVKSPTHIIEPEFLFPPKKWCETKQSC